VKLRLLMLVKAISAQEAITIAFFRGQVTKRLVEAGPQKGAMAAIGIGRTEAIPFLVQGVVIACENSPNSVTISGDKTAVDGLVDRLKVERPDVFVRHLRVEIAYHSRKLPF
jgi:acyl transferase domain-containing protein